jgi:chemotaxis protein CheX
VPEVATGFGIIINTFYRVVTNMNMDSGDAQVPQVVVNAVQAALQTTYRKFCGDDPQISLQNHVDLNSDCVAGIISFLGKNSISVAWVLDRESAPALAEKFARFAIPFDSVEMGDVAGELVNVLAGDIVINLEANGQKVKMSLPTVARGTRLQFIPEKNVHVTRLDYETRFGRFWLRIAVN